MALRLGVGIGISFHRPPVIQKVKFDLLENGLDFLTEAIDTINSAKNHKRLKYALIHLCSGVELIFKEILRRKDWTLLFQKVSEADSNLLITGDFESVNYIQSIKRLESNCGVKFSEDDKKILKELRLKRNKIEHFKIDEKVNSIKGISSKILNLIIQLIEKNIDLNKDISPISKKYIDNLPKELLKFSSYVSERNKTIKPQLEQKIANGLLLVNCPNCFQKALFIDKELKCLFCNYSNAPEVLSIEYNKVISNNPNSDSIICSQCSSASLIIYENKKVCLKCRDITELVQ